MNPLDILKLGHLQFSSHKIRNLLAIVSAGILFSALFTVQFVLAGLKDTLLTANHKITGNEIILISQDCHDVFDDEGTQTFACREDRIRELAEKHNGKILGQAKSVGTAFVVPSDIITDFPWGSISDRPKDTVPITLTPKLLWLTSEYPMSSRDILENIHAASYTNSTIYEEIKNYTPPQFPETASLIQEYTHQVIPLTDSELYIARVSPGSSALLPETNFPNLLNLPLQLMSHIDGRTIIFDDNSSAIEEFTSSLPTDSPVNFLPKTFSILRFTNPEDAFNYETSLHRFNSIATHTVSVDLFGDQIRILRGYNILNNLLLIPLLVLIFVAIIIMSLTFVSLIRQNAAIVALYHSIGATRRDLILIHLVYLFELCLFTIISSLALSLLFTFLISNANSEALSATIAANYMIEQPGFIFLFGLNWQTFLMLGLILLIPFVATLLTFDQLSARNLAHRLKSDN